jgi:hypothetical protein
VCPLGADTSGITLLRPDELAACLAYVREHREVGGPFDVIVSPHWDHSREEYEQAGATWLVDGVNPIDGWVDDLRQRLTSG